MNILELVQESIKEIDEGYKELGLTIQRCIRICYLIGDIDNLIWLKIESSDLRTEKDPTQLDLYDFADKISYPHEDLRERWQYHLLFYRNRRTVKDNKGKEVMFGASISWIENSLRDQEKLIERNVVPEGLHHVDLYFANKEKHDFDMLLVQNKQMFKTILSNVRRRVYETLVRWETELMSGLNTSKVEDVKSKNVFIIHGHSEAKWRELEKVLKDDFSLNPIVLQEQADGGATTIIDKFERLALTCSYAFALFTPDDVVEKEGRKYLQARPNVIFELGWFCAHLGRKNVCMIVQNGEHMEIFSDFQGVIQKRFNTNISELFREIKMELKEAEII